MKSGKIRVLIVVSDTPLAMMMVFTLTRAGCDVDAVHTGKKGLKLACQQRFDLIALEITLPDADGRELCSELKQRHISRKTPVIFISASPLPEKMADAKKLGAADYIIKPFDMTELIYKVIYHARVCGETEGIAA
jgi:DNA-binding response OmpR family regulator